MNELEVLRYGVYLVDEEFYDIDNNRIRDCIETRIRVIKMDSALYYHKMIDGKVVEFKELM